MWSDDPESYVDGSIATGRVSHVRKINGDDPDKKRDTLVLQVRGRLETDNFITLNIRVLMSYIHIWSTYS